MAPVFFVYHTDDVTRQTLASQLRMIYGSRFALEHAATREEALEVLRDLALEGSVVRLFFCESEAAFQGLGRLMPRFAHTPCLLVESLLGEHASAPSTHRATDPWDRLRLAADVDEVLAGRMALARA